MLQNDNDYDEEVGEGKVREFVVNSVIAYVVFKTLLQK